jgi:hypothetical protein
MPGHRAKLGGFFSVIDELYPRQLVIEQIKAFTPQRLKDGEKGPIRVYNQRVTSAHRNGRGQNTTH